MIYFPTTVVLVDDDETFLSSIEKLFYGLNVRVVPFSSPNKAKEFLEKSYQEAQSLNLFPPKEEESWGEWVQKMKNSSSHTQLIPSCVVSDFDMPQKDGISFFKELNLPVSKVLLTGILDNASAVDAFNQRVIDKFLTKDNFDGLKGLTAYVREEVDAFFVRRFSLGSKSDYAEQILKVCADLKIKELYPLDFCGSYFVRLMDGSEKVFFCPSQAHLTLQIQYAQEQGASKMLLQALQDKTGYLLASVDELIESDLQRDGEKLLKELTVLPNYPHLLGYAFKGL